MPRSIQLACLLVLLVACHPAAGGLTPPAASPTPSPLPMTATARPTPLPLLSPPPSPTFIPTATASPPPDPTAMATPSATPVAALTPDRVDRTCRQPYAIDYRRYYLAADPWPTPAPDPEIHFWLSKPLPPGTGRLLVNDLFPYGADYNGRLAMHTGVDVSEELGTPVLAAAEGVVVVAGSDENVLYGWQCNWYGHLVVIEHDFRWHGRPVYTLYGHVLNIAVVPGQRVERGQLIAEVGVGGAATVRHLHLEVRVGTNEYTATRNPMLWVAPGAEQGVIAGRLVDPEGRPWQGVAIHALRQTDNGLEDRVTWSYLGDPNALAQPDEDLAENFVFSDMAAGTYQIYLELQGQSYSQPVMVLPGQLVSVQITTAPYLPVTETPTP